MILHKSIPYKFIEKVIEDIEIQLLTVKPEISKKFLIGEIYSLCEISDNNSQIQKLHILIIYNL